jgi:hypothetical protein
MHRIRMYCRAIQAVNDAVDMHIRIFFYLIKSDAETLAYVMREPQLLNRSAGGRGPWMLLLTCLTSSYRYLDVHCPERILYSLEDFEIRVLKKLRQAPINHSQFSIIAYLANISPILD